jgi:hypothetical protein
MRETSFSVSQRIFLRSSGKLLVIKKPPSVEAEEAFVSVLWRFLNGEAR